MSKSVFNSPYKLGHVNKLTSDSIIYDIKKPIKKNQEVKNSVYF